MAITSILRNFNGTPNLVFIQSTNTLAEMTTTNYILVEKPNIDELNNGDFTFNSDDFCLINYADGEGFFKVNLTDQKFVSATSAGEVITPTKVGHIATYFDTDGTITEDPTIAQTDGALQTGDSGKVGKVIIYPATAASGYLETIASDNTNNAVITQKFDSVQASIVFHKNTPVITPDVYDVIAMKALQNLYTETYSFSTTVSADDLGGGAAFNLILSSGTTRFVILSLNISAVGTNFSGFAGDRDISITDLTNTWSVIPAATLQSLANAMWGVTDLPFPAAGGLSLASVAGLPIKAKYSGGTVDYSAGAIVISGTALRVA